MPRRRGAGLLTLGLVQGVGYVATLGWNVIGARVASVHVYGVVAFGISVVLALQVLLEMGQQRALIRFVSPLLVRGDSVGARSLCRRSLIAPLTAVGVLGGAGLMVAALAPGLAWGGVPFAHWLLLLPAGLGAALASVQTGAYVAAGRAVASSVLGVLAVPVLLCLGFALLGLTGEVTAFGMLAVVCVAYGATGLFAGVKLIAGTVARWSATPAALAGNRRTGEGEYYRFAVKALVIALVSLGLGYADRFLLGAFATFSAVGLYSLPARTARLLNLPIYFLNPLVASVYSAAHGENRMDRALHVYRASARFLSSVVLPIGLTGVLFARPLLAAVGGVEYAPAAPAMMILLLGVLGLTLSGNSGLLLQLAGREGTEVRCSVAGLVVNVAVAVVLLKPLGVLGVAIGTTTGLLVAAGGRLVACRRAWGIGFRDLLGRRQLLGVTAYFIAVLGAKVAALPWSASATVGILGFCMVSPPWLALRILGRAIADAEEVLGAGVARDRGHA